MFAPKNKNKKNNVKLVTCFMGGKELILYYQIFWKLPLFAYMLIFSYAHSHSIPSQI